MSQQCGEVNSLRITRIQDSENRVRTVDRMVAVGTGRIIPSNIPNSGMAVAGLTLYYSTRKADRAVAGLSMPGRD